MHALVVGTLAFDARCHTNLIYGCRTSASLPRLLPPFLVAEQQLPRPYVWERARAGEYDAETSDVLSQDIESATVTLRTSPLHRREFRVLRAIQRIPGFLPVSLGVHYSLLPKVITPSLALIVWLSSLPRGASLITQPLDMDSGTCVGCVRCFGVSRRIRQRL